VVNHCDSDFDRTLLKLDEGLMNIIEKSLFERQNGKEILLMYKITGISGSPRPVNMSLVYKLVKLTLVAAMQKDPLIFKLEADSLSGCRLCDQCEVDFICKIEDQMTLWRSKILESEAFVVGGVNAKGVMHSSVYTFFERLHQFRNYEKTLLSGKLGVSIGVSYNAEQNPADEIEKLFGLNGIETVAKVVAFLPSNDLVVKNIDNIGSELKNMAKNAGLILYNLLMLTATH
jgi:multimeric flavodoxin WrbA